MKEEIKDKLRNAGFKKSINPTWDFDLITPESFGIFIDTKKSIVKIYPASDGLKDQEFEFKDLDELNKICYSTLRKDLDFEKKAYTWENCVKPGGYYVGSHSNIQALIENHELTDDERNLCPTKTAAISILATTQLMQICAKINEDFDRKGENIRYYPILSNGELDYSYSYSKLNQFPMNSLKAVMALILSNPDLLKQYFEANEPNKKTN